MITLKNILIFAGGTAIGALASWYCCKRHYEKILDLYEEEMGKMYYLEEEDSDEDDEEAEEAGTVGENIDYHAFYKKPDPAEQEYPKDDEGDKVKSNKKPPRMITAERFGEDGFTQVYLDFYTEDQALVITDETEAKEIDEVKDWVGDALEKFGFSTNGEDHIYVRNYNRKCDFEIQKVWDRFSPPEADE